MHCFKFFRNIMNNMIPLSLSEYFTVEGNNNQGETKLEYFNCSDSNGKKRLRYHLPQFINSSPACIISKATTHSLIGFKKYVKSYILQNYDDTPCTVQNCYACQRGIS